MSSVFCFGMVAGFHCSFEKGVVQVTCLSWRTNKESVKPLSYEQGRPAWYLSALKTLGQVRIG